jgi:hypothetical protein
MPAIRVTKKNNIDMSFCSMENAVAVDAARLRAILEQMNQERGDH